MKRRSRAPGRPRPLFRRVGRYWARTGLGLLCLGFVACSGGGEGRAKPAGSALVVEAGTTIPATAVRALESVGVTELFVVAGELVGEGAALGVAAGPLPTSPSRASATLVLRGRWDGSEEEARAAGPALAASVVKLTSGARDAGWIPLGLHFEVEAASGLRAWGALLKELRREMDRTLFLSARLRRDEAMGPEADAVADAVDFLVVPLYGQRPGEPEERAAWDLRQVEAGLKRLEELGCDYLVEVSTVGRAQRTRDNHMEETTFGSLSDLVRSPWLELSRGFTLDAVDAQIYSFAAGKSGNLLDWQVNAGDLVRMIRLGSHNVEEYRRRAGTLELHHRLGDLFYRWTEEEEGFSLSVDNWVAALAAEPALAELKLTVDLLSTRGATRRYRVAVENRSAEPTDIAVLSSNFVELKAVGGILGRVEAGGFARWELLREGRDGKLVRSFRGATVVRLYATYLGPSERQESGIIEVIGSTGEVRAEFLLPDGREAALSAEPPP